MLHIVTPVLQALEKEELKKTMPLDFHGERAPFAPLEAFGRSMLGLAPWLEAEGLEGEEKELQETYRSLAVRCIDKATDPESADFMIFNEGGQPLVDTAFLCHALVRAPRQLAGSLPERVHRNLAAALRSSRQIVACNSNWIFFSAMVEAGLYVLGEKDYDKMRIAYALRVFDGWYKGDGVYGDGEMFHWDYYNSFVIQPMYLDLAEMFVNLGEEFRELEKRVAARAARYASVLERMIAPDGSYPILGRSICYRFGAFQMLSQAALEHRLEGADVWKTRKCLIKTAGCSRESADASPNWRRAISMWEACTCAAPYSCRWAFPSLTRSGPTKMRTGPPEKCGAAATYRLIMRLTELDNIDPTGS